MTALGQSARQREYSSAPMATELVCVRGVNRDCRRQEIDMPDASFDQFMQQRSRVAAAFVNGDPGPLRDISTSADPATFYGPGGGAEQGAAHVIAVNEAGAHQFRPGGTTRLEVLHSAADGNLGYWTGFQHATVHVENQPEPVPMKLRVTEIFRRENGAWKLVHRHADPLAEAKPKR
jgi:ketosteroid isomerase-like protein